MHSLAGLTARTARTAGSSPRVVGIASRGAGNTRMRAPGTAGRGCCTPLLVAPAHGTEDSPSGVAMSVIHTSTSYVIRKVALASRAPAARSGSADRLATAEDRSGGRCAPAERSVAVRCRP